MKKKSIKKITLTRLLQVFVLALVITVAVIAFSYRSFAQFAIENKALSIAEVIKAGLTSHMKAKIMDKRDYFLNEITTIHDIESIKIIRADAIHEQFGTMGSFEQELSDDLRDILEKKEVYFKWEDRASKVEVIVPYVASSKGTLNCLQCHDVNDGEILGAVNINMNIGLYQGFALRYSYIIITVLLLLALMIVLNMFHVIERYIRQPLSNIIHEGELAYISNQNINSDNYESREFEDVAVNINKFNQNILCKEEELKEKNIQLQRLNEEIESTLKETLLAMGQIEEIRSCDTKRHAQRVSTISTLIAKTYGLNDEQIKLIELASPMHDIGKIGIADAVLNKPAKLTEEEFMLMKTHSILGYEILKHSKRPVLQAAASIAYGHHEKYDGTGYPQGLKANEISIFARIVTIVDVVDALLSKRIYKDIWSVEKVITLLKEERGKHFDPKLVDIVLDNMDEYVEIIRDLSEGS